MFLEYFIASKEEIKAFLELIKKIVSSKQFSISTQMVLDLNKPENNITLSDLEYDIKNVLNEIKSLTISNYYQSVPDLNRKDDIPYHVFFKNIGTKEIYIKIKVKNNKIIICKSFHRAEFSHGKFPY